MLDPAADLRWGECGALAQLHHKGPVRRQRRQGAWAPVRLWLRRSGAGVARLGMLGPRLRGHLRVTMG
jgi:hypothetical protein